MTTSESNQSPSGASSPQPIGEIASAIERSKPAPAEPPANERPAVEPIGEVESAIERSRKQA